MTRAPANRTTDVNPMTGVNQPTDATDATDVTRANPADNAAFQALEHLLEQDPQGFLGELPGLLTSPDGRRRLLGIRGLIGRASCRERVS